MKQEQKLVTGVLAIGLLLLTFVFRGFDGASVGPLQITGVVLEGDQGENSIILTITNRSDGEFLLFYDNYGPRVSQWVEVNNTSADIYRDSGRAEMGIFRAHSKIVFTNHVPQGVGNVRYELTGYQIPKIWSWLQKINQRFDSSSIDSVQRRFRVDRSKPVGVFSEKFLLTNGMRSNRSSADRAP